MKGRMLLYPWRRCKDDDVCGDGAWCDDFISSTQRTSEHGSVSRTRSHVALASPPGGGGTCTQLIFLEEKKTRASAPPQEVTASVLPVPSDSTPNPVLHTATSRPLLTAPLIRGLGWDLLHAVGRKPAHLAAGAALPEAALSDAQD